MLCGSISSRLGIPAGGPTNTQLEKAITLDFTDGTTLRLDEFVRHMSGKLEQWGPVLAPYDRRVVC